ncbi:MAG: peptidase T [Bacteroidales bacterium]|nr:peptidase T [Bacteroidales bacterium]
MNLVDRFLLYVQKDTQSDEDTDLVPSTPAQMSFAKELTEELKQLGLQDVALDGNGYVMATLPANSDESRPVIGFIAHMDTSPDLTGRNVCPKIITSYQGGDIILDPEEPVVLSPSDFPELSSYIGQDLICTNGKTLLGADDKAGIAEIVTAMEYLMAHPEIKHGKIRIAFTPDEEIGKGPDHFNVEVFGASFAYTMDGGEIGELEYENFNAASAKITFKGRNVHPGYAKHKMLNSIRIANQFVGMLPRSETPEHTEGYEGFYHLTGFHGDVETTVLSYIIRDHDRDRFDRRKKEVEHLVNKINSEYGASIATLDMKDQYYNMREKIDPDNMYVINLAIAAMEAVGVTPQVRPIRGGTDGARLSFMGLPCPNIFAGGLNFHGRFEFVPIPSMEKAMQVIIKISELTTINLI